ncbi:hypothetical protein BV25DRAFT_1832401 [Artomyces pyxidatus]|uniref:Uncharacterized protein n=1 Tax=Artomyces pyxidatus TaxID=48021 RepID=A0ACB8SJE5_9AGAM|nr:hypothetical protein BV25DRAFT_1832401 [Artomyces pyxidatus]
MPEDDFPETGIARVAGANDGTPSPIAILPVELLVSIFRYLQPAPFPLLHVCGLWRQIACNDKVLWSEIPLGHHGQAQFALRQSQPNPISVRWDHPSSHPESPDSGALHLALEELPRVRHIKLCLRSRPTVGVLSQLWMDRATWLMTLQPAPFLKTLHLETRDFRHETFDRAIFLDETPSELRAVYLKRFMLSPASILFTPSLTSLSLLSCYVWETFDEMLDALVGMPQLRHLHLRDALPRDLTFPASAEPLTLPHLQTLLLGGWAPKVESSLRAISAPNATLLDIELDRTGSDSQMSPKTFYQALSQWIKTSSAPCTYQTLSFRKGETPLQTDIVVDTSATHEDGIKPRKLTVRVLLPVYMPSTFFWEFLTKSDISNQDFEAFTNGLQELTVYGISTCNELLGSFESCASSPNSVLLFPNLTHLRLQNFPFPAAPKQGTASEKFRSLVLNMQRRQSRGSRCHLSISDCILTAKQIKELRNTIGADYFHWDNKRSLAAYVPF